MFRAHNGRGCLLEYQPAQAVLRKGRTASGYWWGRPGQFHELLQRRRATGFGSGFHPPAFAAERGNKHRCRFRPPLPFAALLPITRAGPGVGDEHFRALRCEGFGRGRANAVVGAADRDDFVFKLGVNHLSGYIAYLISISNSINQEIPYQ